MVAEKVGSETLLSRVVQMVAEAQRSRAPIQRMADQVSGWFAPVVIAVALVVAGACTLFGPDPRLTYSLVAVITVLIGSFAIADEPALLTKHMRRPTLRREAS